MHDRMFKTILQAPVRFFDSNSVGKGTKNFFVLARLLKYGILDVLGNILNRFSKDMGQIDEDLPGNIMEIFEVSTFAIQISKSVNTLLLRVLSL